MRLNDIPLFPLNSVLFPQMVLPLVIFEPRYRLMINECLKNDVPFGVVLLQTGDEVQEGQAGALPAPARPCAVGTLARITEVTRLDDGRLMLSSVGTERFRLIEYHTEKSYMTGDIELWPDGASDRQQIEVEGHEVRRAFKRYLQVLIELAGKQIQSFDLPDDPAILSNLVPNWLYVDLPEKQRLLEIENPYSRLLAEKEILQTETQFFMQIKDKAAEQGWTGQTPPEMPDLPPMPGAANYNPGSRFSPN